jgi:hypothetical protein
MAPFAALARLQSHIVLHNTLRHHIHVLSSIEVGGKEEQENAYRLKLVWLDIKD